jgi:hypothetical protein
MKTNLRILLGLIVLISITTLAYAGTLPVKTAHNMTAASPNKLSKIKKTTLEPGYVFTYTATPVPGGDDDVVITLNYYNGSTLTPTSVSVPLTITLSSVVPAVGGESFTFPANTMSKDYGDFNFGGVIPNTIPITAPTTVDGDYTYPYLYLSSYAATYF